MIDRKKIKFECVTYLAIHLADIISTYERGKINDSEQESDQISSVTQLCVPSTLLKSKTYRPLLDAWIKRYTDQPNNIRDAEYLDIKFKLMAMLNENLILKEENMALMEIMNRNNTSLQLVSQENDGMLIADALLKHFSSFWRIEGNTLIQPSAGRPIIVSGDLFQRYLDWKRRELPKK